MKIETRTVYIAEDGEEFNRKSDCVRYERNGCVDLIPLDDFGEHQPLEAATLHWMLNGDGSCYYATATKQSRITAGCGPHPVWATHLVYFGK